MPKVVIRRLGERDLRPDASHPDADLLTGFVERALPERDRGAVLSHLADCASCREIVALAQPAEVANTVVVGHRSRSTLFLRWGVLAASAGVVIGFAVLHQRQPGDTPLLATNKVSEPMSERRLEPPPSDKVVLGDTSKRDATNVANKIPPAASPAMPRQEHQPAANVPQDYVEKLPGMDAKAKPVPVPQAPSSTGGNAGFLGHDAIVSDNVPSKSLGLPLNGRNVNQLMKISPGVVGSTQTAADAGAAAGAEPLVARAMPAAAEVTRDRLAKKEEGDYSLHKTVASPSASQMGGRADALSDTRARAAGAVMGGVIAAAPPVAVAGEVRGLVVDPAGAAVSGAKVTITNTATGVSLASSTNEVGNYDVPLVPPGPYTIAISKPGFLEFVQQGLNVEPSTIALNTTLRVGVVSETVEVTARAPTVETSSSNTAAYGGNDKDSFRASSAEIANLPNLVPARPAGSWQITDAGNLQRSFDGGKSWESVPVVQAGSNQPGRLRVVAATGFQVWVGGNGGVLLHSQDAGGHFTNVRVHKKHAALTGDIVALTFPDSQHGRLETVDHDVWTTSDGGKTWQPAAAAK